MPMPSSPLYSRPLAVVIPVFNHGRTIADVARRTLALGFSVFVVDDGSEDAIFGLEPGPTLHLFRHPINRGKGAALITGLTAAFDAGFDRAVTLDADGQHLPEEIPILVQKLPADKRAIVVGRRTDMQDAGAPWTSRFGREFSNFWIRWAGGPSLSDTQSGFRLYPLPEVLNLGVRARRYQFELELLIRAAQAGIPIVETSVSVIYRPPGGRISHFHPFFDFLRNTGMFTRMIFRRIFCAWRKDRTRKAR
ncbi:glycosyltransferase family 2 protein [Desulfosarcina sp. OttesenSCG-928-G10]|nr:glycosyltransferase family 2 protein [Desulfosarcina sp. OttesenSCG-928-G10]MDL2320900.1 glycosyltransferase family 2 protein [Desulfosarcina sp. OttesenSCG-928-B08]